VSDNVDFCPGCGTNIKDLRKMVEQQPVQPQQSAQSAETVVSSVPINNINNSIQNSPPIFHVHSRFSTFVEQNGENFENCFSGHILFSREYFIYS
jgi:hypothetical protein